MSEGLSIEEILKQAEEIRKKAEKTAKTAVEEANAAADEFKTRELKIPKDTEAPTVRYDMSNSSAVQATQVIPAPSEENKKAAQDKTAVVNIGAKTGVVPDVKSARKSYFHNQSSDEPIYSKRPPEMVERPATIRSRTSFDKASDLEEMPTIVSVDELEHTKISIGSNQPPRRAEYYESDEDDQIVLEGFEDGIDRVEKIDERVAEEQLAKKREDKINKFRLFSPDEIDDDESKSKIVKKEYEHNGEKTAFLERLFASKSAVTLTAVITFILGAALALLTALKDTVHLPQLLLDDTAYFTTMVIIYSVVLLVNIKNIVHGFNFKNSVNSDFPISVACLIIFAHTLMMAVNTELYIDNGSPFAFLGAFALLFSNLGKRSMLTRIIENFEFLSEQEGNLHTVEDIANAVDATIISRGVLTGEANLKTSIKTDFSTKFLDIACSNEPADNLAKITGLVMLGLNAVAFIVFSIINGSWHFGFNLAVCGIGISLPCISLYCTNQALLEMSRRLKVNGAMINGFEGASTVNNTNAIVIEAQDLFGVNSCQIHGRVKFNKVKPDELILYTAAVIMKTKSPLVYEFKKYIVGDNIIPEIDGVVYEDKLGTSAWLYRKKVLVGTRELLIHHGVQVPTEDYENRHTKKGEKALYLAIAGKLMTMFVVSYSADPKLKRVLKRLEKSGMTVLVKSSDPYITDDSLAELFSVPKGFMRVISAANARTFEKYSDKCVEKSPAYIVHNGSALGFVSAMDAAENLEDTRKLLSVLISFGCAIGLGIAVLLGIVGGITQLNALNIAVFQAVWCIFIRIMTKLKRSI